jgi:tRNA threonylcarbamoyladenosine biosynthesis protein TsaB
VLVLALDASTYAGSVALIRDGATVAERTTGMRGEREERLMPAVAGVFRDAGVDLRELDAVACGAGPGSFTSLRIAASIAKGIAVAREIPLVVAPSPLLVVAGAVPARPEGRYLLLMDAMRGDVFAQLARVDARGMVSGEGPAWLARRAEAVARAAREGASVMGPAESPAVAPHARGFARLLANGEARAVDVAAWEPDYGRKAEAQVRWEQAHGRALEVP